MIWTERWRGSQGILAVFLLGGALLSSCKSHSTSASSRESTVANIRWQRIGTWSGRGDAQTESFDIGYEQCRVLWETKNESSPGAGDFELTLNSAVSGRVLQPLAHYEGLGHDIAYSAIDPHFSYLVISSKNVDWTVTVEEPQLATPSDQPR